MKMIKAMKGGGSNRWVLFLEVKKELLKSIK